MTGGEAPYSYQWYADGEEIKGATKSSYNVTSYDLGKELSVAVMDADGNSDLSDETDAVVEKFALSEVLLDNTTPKVGDLLTATAYDAFGEDVSSECTWQWYRVTEMGMTVKIANQTKRTYTVGAIDRGAVLYAVATNVYGIEYTSNESTPNRAESVSDVRILGISGKQTYSKINDVAILGDELRVDATPSASLTGVDYQWYRGKSKIVGATDSTYTVTAEDIGTQIGVAIEIPATLGYGFLADVTSNADVYSTVAGANMAAGRYAYVELKNDAANDVAIQTASLTNQSPSVGQTTTARVRFDKNKDGDVEDSGDYLDLNNVDGNVIWYRNEIDPKNIVGRDPGYQVRKADAGSVLIAKVTGKDGTEFNGEIEIATDTVKKEIATVTVDASEIVAQATSPGLVGERVTASIKDKAGADVPSTGYDLQWYINNVAVNGATSATLQITPAIATQHLVPLVNTAPTFKCEVVGKGDYSGSVQGSANGAADGGTRWAATPATVTAVTLKNEAGTALTAATTVSKGETLKVTTTPAAAVDDFDWVWYYGDPTAGTPTLSASASGSSFKLGDGVVSGDKIFVVPTPKAAANQAINWKKTDGTTNADAAFLVGTAAAALRDKTIKSTAGTAAGNDSVVSALLGIGTASVTIDNGMTGDDKKTFTAPEVGTYVTASTTNTPAGLSYEWTYDEGGAPSTTANVATHIVTSEDLGLTLKCKISLANDGNGYSKSQVATVKTGPVLPSSRTFQEVRIYKAADINAIVDKGTFEAKASETKLDNTITYHIVVLDSWNQIHKVVTGDKGTEYVLLDRDNQKCHRNTAVTFGNGEGGDYALKAGEVITVMVVPDQIEFSGATIEVPFSSAVS